MFEFELSRHQFKRTSPGILSRPRRIASTLLKGYVPGLCLRLKNSFMNFSCFYIALIPLPFDSTTALSPSPRFLFVANGLWGRSTARRSCVCLERGRGGEDEEGTTWWSANARGEDCTTRRLDIIVSNLVASLNCSTNFFVRGNSLRVSAIYRSDQIVISPPSIHLTILCATNTIGW